MSDIDRTMFKGHDVALLTASQGTEYISETKINMTLSIDDETALLINRLTTKLTDSPDMLAAYIILLQGIQDKAIEPVKKIDSASGL